MSFGPFFRSPFTDLTGSLVNAQQYDKCGAYEMQVMDCLEAYGTERGKTKCQNLIEDFGECVGMRKQMLRFYVSNSIRKLIETFLIVYFVYFRP